MYGNCLRSYMNFRLPGRRSMMDLSDKVYRENLKQIRELIPNLTTKLRKGECGRIGVIGGNAEYSGAPYYSAISALKVGADVAYIICCKEAGIPIKSYSPAMIVYPYLDHSEVIYKTSSCLDRVHCLVIGPGLGREPDVLKNVQSIINYCNYQLASPIPLIFDADGLFMITENLQIIKDYKGLIFLTPNVIECARLCEKLGLREQQLVEVSRLLNVVIIKKGEVDTISNGLYQRMLKLPPEYTTTANHMTGSKRRCAGQGDILAGCLATFVTWFVLHKRKQLNTSWNDIFILQSIPNVSEWDIERRKKIYDEKYRGFTAACYGASLVTRQSSILAFGKHGRGMTATEVINYISHAFTQFFG